MVDVEAAYRKALRRYNGSNLRGLSKTDRVLVTIWWLEGDVNNGGFDQYFSNSSGNLAFFAVKALRRIGANATADIVANAVSIFCAAGVPRDRVKREDALERLHGRYEEYLNELSSQFYAEPDDVSALVEGYLARSAQRWTPMRSIRSTLKRIRCWFRRRRYREAALWILS